MAEPLDWLESSVEDRKALYRITMQTITRGGLTWEDVYVAAFGKNHGTGTNYESNFRAGRISRKRAHLIYLWLVADHPAYAMQLDDELGRHMPPSDVGARWRALLKEHGRYDRVSVVLLPEPSIGIVAFARPERLAKPVIPLGAPFCFQIESMIDGAVMALQSFGGLWHPLPLRENGLIDAIAAGVHFLPRLPDRDEPFPLSEEEHSGRHGFAFLIGAAEMIEAAAVHVPSEAAIPNIVLDQIAEVAQACDGQWLLLRINLLVGK